MAFEMLKAQQAEAWGAAPWERAAPDIADLHDDLVSRLGVGAGERWLDLATGTGAVATRAARQGAVVTGLDLAPSAPAISAGCASQRRVDPSRYVNTNVTVPRGSPITGPSSAQTHAHRAPAEQAIAGGPPPACV
jgi:hypothetical protein